MAQYTGRDPGRVSDFAFSGSIIETGVESVASPACRGMAVECRHGLVGGFKHGWFQTAGDRRR